MHKISATKILSLLFASGKGIKEAADAAGVSATALSVAIRHGRQCRYTTIAKLASFFGVEPTELFADETV